MERDKKTSFKKYFIESIKLILPVDSKQDIEEILDGSVQCKYGKIQIAIGGYLNNSIKNLQRSFELINDEFSHIVNISLQYLTFANHTKYVTKKSTF